MSLRHEDYCTFLTNPDDRDILTRPLFNVNLRLLKSSDGYRAIVQSCASYILWCAQTEKEGYSKPKGYSGANAGIPFNIVATAKGDVLLNPKVIQYSSACKETSSNCGSLLLKLPIWVRRPSHVVVEYYDLEGVRHTLSGFIPTIQHEIDHNNGILILDREVKP